MLFLMALLADWAWLDILIPPPLLIATGEAIPLRGLEGVPGLPGAPQDWKATSPEVPHDVGVWGGLFQKRPDPRSTSVPCKPGWP